jgi:hypothetical protein
MTYRGSSIEQLLAEAADHLEWKPETPKKARDKDLYGAAGIPRGGGLRPSPGRAAARKAQASVDAVAKGVSRVTRGLSALIAASRQMYGILKSLETRIEKLEGGRG